MMARILQEVPTGHLMAAMQSLKLPKNFILTLAVTLRFFPIIKTARPESIKNREFLSTADPSRRYKNIVLLLRQSPHSF
jgi:hypothetical protein